MITEQGRVVALEADGVWVETASQSACASCAARKGCGQGLLAQMDGHRTYIKVAFSGFASGDFREGDIITIGIHESAVLRGSLMVYLLPLMGLIAGALIAHLMHFPELAVAASAIAGLALAAFAVRRLCRRYDRDERFQPVVVQPAGHVVSLIAAPSVAPESQP